MRRWWARRTKKGLWIALACVVLGAPIAILIAAVAYTSVDSVSVRFVNNTDVSVILPDCGPDVETVNAQSSLVVNVYQPTSYCSIDTRTESVMPNVRCLKMPSPLTNGDEVKVSQATAEPRFCG
jgi:hypothetical protein